MNEESHGHLFQFKFTPTRISNCRVVHKFLHISKKSSSKSKTLLFMKEISPNICPLKVRFRSIFMLISPRQKYLNLRPKFVELQQIEKNREDIDDVMFADEFVMFYSEHAE